MAILKAFKGLRPPKEIARDLASRPYDVLNSEEARKEAYGNKYSLLHIIKPEIDLPEDIDLYAPEVYKKAKENFELFQKNGWLVPDDDEYLYIYAQTMNNKTQYGEVEFIEESEEKVRALNIIMHHYTGKEFKYSAPSIREILIWRVRVDKWEGRYYRY
jgi:uncharacterized protein (DUF1015 family)